MLDTARCLGCMKARAGSARCACGFDSQQEPASPLHLRPSTVLREQYLVGRVLGQGGFGITYLCWQLSVGRVVAIKEFMPLGL